MVELVRDGLTRTPITRGSLGDALDVALASFPEEDHPGIRFIYSRLLDGAHYWDPGEGVWCTLHTYYVWRVGGVPAAVTGIYQHTETGTYWLGWFGVRPEFRRQGIGTEVLRVVERDARALGTACLYLYTGAENKAGRAFWEAQGYRVTGSTFLLEQRLQVVYRKVL